MDVEVELTKLFNDPRTSAMSRDRFYDIVRQQSHLNGWISRRDCDRFLKNQESWQLHRKVIKPSAVKPILTDAPRELFQVDLVMLNGLEHWNNGYLYCLIAVDAFTKKAWARPLKTKSAEECAEAMDSILQSTTKPKRINTDNGNEFINPAFTGVLAKYGIRHTKSRSYTPQMNSIVESFNRTFKALLFGAMTKYSTKNWVPLVEGVLAAYNSSKHSTTKARPDEVEKGLYHDQVRNLIHTRAQRVTQRQPTLPPLAVGDTVRLLNAADGAPDVFEKSYTTKWSKELYTVEKIQGPGYYISGSTRRYRRYELQRVDPDKIQRSEPIRSRREQQLVDLHAGLLSRVKTVPATTPRVDRQAEVGIEDPIKRLKYRLHNVLHNYNEMSKSQMLLELEPVFPRAHLGARSIHQLRALVEDVIRPALDSGSIPVVK